MRRLAYALRRFQPFLEASIAGLIFASIEVHVSSRPASGRLLLAFLAMGLLLGFRHAGRGAWLCWGPLGLAVYLVHLAAIHRGYLPPLVETDALAARAAIGMFFPAAGVLLFLGVLARVGASRCGWMRRDGEPVRILPRSTLGLIGIVPAAWVALMLLNWSSGVETVYAPAYDEARFQRIRPGMSASEVQVLVGSPLKKIPRDDGKVDWWYSMGATSTSDHWRRWVIIKDDKVDLAISDFWYD